MPQDPQLLLSDERSDGQVAIAVVVTIATVVVVVSAVVPVIVIVVWGVATVIVFGVAPTHEQALEYRTLPEQADA